MTTAAETAAKLMIDAFATSYDDTIPEIAERVVAPLAQERCETPAGHCLRRAH